MQTIVVENRRPSLIGALGFRLEPGENDVDKELYEKWVATPIGKMLSKARMVKVRKDLRQATPQHEKLSDVEEGKAVLLVEGCKNLQLLKRWAQNDHRARVQRALQARMAQFAVPELPEVDEPEPDEAKGQTARKG